MWRIFFNVNMFLKCKLNVSINDNSFKYICVVCYLKLRFYCLTYIAMSNLNLADFTTTNSHQRFHFLKQRLCLSFILNLNLTCILNSP